MNYDQSDHPFGSDPDLMPVNEAPDVSEEFSMLMSRAGELQRFIDAATLELKTVLKPAIAANLLYSGYNSLIYGDREFVYVAPHGHTSLDANAVKDFLIELGATPADISDRCYKKSTIEGGVTIRKYKMKNANKVAG